jgi:DNA-binding PadR family transcriptional regulator
LLDVPLDALANRLVLPLLGLLVERPAHPYELTARLNERYRFLATRRSTVTTLVKSLADAGLIRPQRPKRVGNRPTRRAYELTDAGLEEFRSRVSAQIEESPAASSRFTLALAYIGILSRAKGRAVLRRRMTSLREELEAIPPLERGPTEVHMIEVAYWKTVLESEIRWLDMLVDRIASRDIAWPLDSGRER